MNMYKQFASILLGANVVFHSFISIDRQNHTAWFVREINANPFQIIT